jgi:hypothetical protein
MSASPCIFAGSRARLGRRFLLLVLIERDRGTDEIFQRPLIDLVALEKIDGAPLIAFEPRVEQFVGIGQPISGSRQMDSSTISGANASAGSRIRYLRHPTFLLTRAADEG